MIGAKLAADLQGCTGPNCVDTPDHINLISNVSLGSGATGIINVMTLIAIVVATIFLMIAGIRFVTGGSNAQQIAGARNTITYAIIGMIVAILARIIVGFILQNSP